MCCSIPSLLPTLQVRLLECISGVLSRHQQVQSRPSVAISRTSSTAATLQVAEPSGSALVQLALQTLARFNFKVVSSINCCASCFFLTFSVCLLLYFLYNSRSMVFLDNCIVLELPPLTFRCFCFRVMIFSSLQENLLWCT